MEYLISNGTKKSYICKQVHGADYRRYQEQRKQQTESCELEMRSYFLTETEGRQMVYGELLKYRNRYNAALSQIKMQRR